MGSLQSWGAGIPAGTISQPQSLIGEIQARQLSAVNSWYGVFKSRREEIHAIAGHSDDLAVGARKGGTAVASPAHAQMFGRARLFGVGACPGYGKEMVDGGTLTASVAVRPNAGLAVSMLKRFWTAGEEPPARSSSEAVPYPAASDGPGR